MHDTLADDLQPALTRWTMGGAAAPVAPEWMKGKLGSDPDEAELRLLAIAGQALGMMVVPEPAGDLQGLPDLPALGLPTIPDVVRPLTTRILARRDEWPRSGLLRLIETRGYVVHPSDWMPRRSESIPQIYAPWQDWLEGVSPTGGGRAQGWDGLGPAGRLAMLAHLRRSDPDAALAMIVEKLPGETAERRLSMVETLSTRLDERDRAFLTDLSADRAPTVRAAATRLLARLGGGATGADADVADILRVETKGVLRRQRVISVPQNLNHAQRARLNGAFNSGDAGGVARAIGTTDVELPMLWQWGRDTMVDQWFASMLTATGSDAVMASLDQAIMAGATITVSTLLGETSRISTQAVHRLTASSYAAENLINVATTVPILGIVEDHEASREWSTLLAGLKSVDEIHPTMWAMQLESLGLLVTAGAARKILDEVSASSIPLADPRLDTLRINAAL